MYRSHFLSFCLVFSLLPVLPAAARQAGFDSVLKKLLPEDRIVQACNMAIEDRLSKETKYHAVDRIAPDAGARSHIAKHRLEVSKGAFRSRGQWYKIRYSCNMSKDNMRALNSDFEVLSSEPIPERKWDRLKLYH